MLASERAGVPARTMSPANDATPSAVTTASVRRSDGRGIVHRSRARMISGRAAQTIVSVPSSATFAWNSVVIGAINSDESKPIATA